MAPSVLPAVLPVEEANALYRQYVPPQPSGSEEDFRLAECQAWARALRTLPPTTVPTTSTPFSNFAEMRGIPRIFGTYVNGCAYLAAHQPTGYLPQHFTFALKLPPFGSAADRALKAARRRALSSGRRPAVIEQPPRLVDTTSTLSRAVAMAQIARLSTRTFHVKADAYLEALFGELQEVEETKHNVEVELADGMLTYKVSSPRPEDPSHGPSQTHILHKMSAAKQFWLSSPVSGPSHFDYVTIGGSDAEWVNLRDGSTLTALLRTELAIKLDTVEEMCLNMMATLRAEGSFQRADRMKTEHGERGGEFETLVESRE